MPNVHRPGYYHDYYLNVTKPKREAGKGNSWELCWWCNTAFKPVNRLHVYHSPACRKRASRARLASKE